MPPAAVVAFSTVASAAAARALARALVDERLCACVSVVPGVRSIYRWRGRVESAAEWLLVMKVSRARLAALKKRLPELHPYELPELIALPVVGGHRPYLDWIAAETATGRKDDPGSRRRSNSGRTAASRAIPSGTGPRERGAGTGRSRTGSSGRK